jgi:hypothetical protein
MSSWMFIFTFFSQKQTDGKHLYIFAISIWDWLFVEVDIVRRFILYKEFNLLMCIILD